ncbi:MAG TPA: GNAT family N-acetyltransferase [Magnetospirillaceae bacterium]
MITIRPYRFDDLDTVIDIFLRAIREIASRDYTPAQIEAWAQVDRASWAEWRLSRPTWVAVVDGMPAGFADLEPDGHLDMMFVHPAFRRVGVASALLEFVQESARAQELTRLFTESSLTAQLFFLQHGFRVVAQQSVRKRGQDLTNFRMEKTLV